jgi:hypothetical protein
MQKSLEASDEDWMNLERVRKKVPKFSKFAAYPPQIHREFTGGG